MMKIQTNQFDWTVDESINEAGGESINEADGESIDDAVDKSIDDAVDKSICTQQDGEINAQNIYAIMPIVINGKGTWKELKDKLPEMSEYFEDLNNDFLAQPIGIEYAKQIFFILMDMLMNDNFNICSAKFIYSVLKKLKSFPIPEEWMGESGEVFNIFIEHFILSAVSGFMPTPDTIIYSDDCLKEFVFIIADAYNELFDETLRINSITEHFKEKIKILGVKLDLIEMINSRGESQDIVDLSLKLYNMKPKSHMMDKINKIIDDDVFRENIFENYKKKMDINHHRYMVVSGLKI